MKPKSLCFTGEARLPCLSRLQVQLPIKAGTCYREKVELFTNSGGGRREGGKEVGRAWEEEAKGGENLNLFLRL